LPASGDSTVCFWAKFPTVSTSPTHQVAYAILDNPAVYTQYTAVYANATNSILQVTGPLTVNGTAPSAATWVHYAWTQSGTTQRLYINGTSVGTFTLNRAAFTNGFELMGGDTITAQTDVTVAYCREWTTALSASQIQTEMVSSVAVSSSSLYMDCPFVSDLLDDSGSSHGWTQVGSGSFVAGPTVLTNTTPATAIALPAIPFTATYTIPVNYPHLVADLYFTYTHAATTDLMVNLFAYGPFGGQYKATTSITDGADITINSTNNRAIEIPVIRGHAYTIDIENGGVATTAESTLTIEGVTAPTTEVVNGSLFIPNDNQVGFPGIVLDPTTGSVLRFIDVLQGDAGQNLPNGILLLEDIIGQNVVLYAADFSVITTVHTANSSPKIGTDHASLFYIADRSTHVVTTLTDTGVTGGTTWTLTAPDGISSLAPNRANTILYYSSSATNKPVLAWDLVNNVALANLASGTAGKRNTLDILVLSDGTILVGSQTTSGAPSDFITRYDSSGTVLNTYTIPAGQGVNRMAIALDDPTSFWVWTYVFSGASPTGFSDFTRIKVSDGSTVTAITGVAEYGSTGYLPLPASADIARFGPPTTCPLLILPVSASAVGEPVEYLIRRERIFPHIGQEQMRQFFSKLQIDLYAGNGISTGQGSDPLLEIDWSDDGGHTWSDIHFVQTGAIGAFRTRAILRRMGSSRDRVYRIACSDPVQWSIINGFLDATLGTS
jgi:hypothetical protein